MHPKVLGVVEENAENICRSSEVHETLQAEMLAQLTQDLKERLLSEGMLNKLVLINIAAEAYAANRRPGMDKVFSLMSPEAYSSCAF